MANQSNDSNHLRVAYDTEPYFLYPISALYVALISIATVGNSLVILTICKWPSLRKSTTNCFILSLAFSDILTASIAMSMDLDQLLNDAWNHGEVMCEIWATVYLSTVPTSILTLMAVGLDRYKTLNDPLSKFREYQFMTRKRAALVIVGIWVYAITFALIPFMGWKHYPRNIIEGECLFNITYVYSATSSFVNFILPLLVTTFLYVKIYLIAYRNGGEHLVENPSGQNHVLHETTGNTVGQKAFMNNLKAARTVSVIVCGFLVCWLPFTLLSITMSFCYSCLYYVPQKLYACLLLLGYSNCALNPLLYSFKNKKFRSCCKQMVRSLWSRTPEFKEMNKKPSRSCETQSTLKRPRGLSEIVMNDVYKDTIKTPIRCQHSVVYRSTTELKHQLP